MLYITHGNTSKIDRNLYYTPHKGSWFGLPDYEITEKIGSLLGSPRTKQGGSDIWGSQLKPKVQQSVMGASSPTSGYQQYSLIPGSTGTSGTTGFSSGGTNVIPATGGEGTSGGTDGGSGYDFLGALRSTFDKSRGALESILPTYDADYANFEKSTNDQVDYAKQTKLAQDQADEITYGKSLRNLIRTDNDLRQRRQGVFSSLNALDSSAFRDDVNKGDQALLENQQNLEAEKRNYAQERLREYTAYENAAKTKLGEYKNEISRAKAGLQQAIASVNMDEAASIQNYISQLDTQKQQIEANLMNVASNLAQLQAQGVNVAGNLRNLNMGQYANAFGQNIANKVNQVVGRYTLPTQSVQGSGFINPKTGRAYTDEERKILGI